jgi:hypothetical protein
VVPGTISLVDRAYLGFQCLFSIDQAKSFLSGKPSTLNILTLQPCCADLVSDDAAIVSNVTW